jgi:hypothetical protein
MGQIISQLQERCPGFSISCEDGCLVKSSPLPILSLPSSANTLTKAVEWMQTRDVKNVSEIGIRDNIIACSLSHVVADGGAITNLISSLGCEKQGFTNPYLYSYSDLFGGKLNNIENATFKTDELYKIYPSTSETGTKLVSKSIYFQTPLRELPFWNPKTEILENMLEHIWAGMLASTAAHNVWVSPQPRSGVLTLINLRKWANSDIPSWNIGNCFTGLVASAGGFSFDESVQEITNRMRTGFQRGISAGEHLRFIHSQIKGDFKTVYGENEREEKEPLTGCLSSIGRIEIHEPLVDIFIGQRWRNHVVKGSTMITPYSIIGQGKSDFAGKFEYDSSLLSRSDAELITKRIVRSLKTDLRMRFGDFVESICEL